MAGEPSIDKMLKMKSNRDLVKLCRSIGVEGDLVTVYDCHKALLNVTTYRVESIVNNR